MDNQELTRMVTEFYLNSHDFNGLLVRDMFRTARIEHDSFDSALKDLVAVGQIDLVFEDLHPNPSIRAFASPSAKEQLQLLEKFGWDSACAYPTASHLAKEVPPTAYSDKPFTRELALGRPQLEFHSFDISILEAYREDPRYWYRTYDRGGSISATDDLEMRDGDQVLLQSFGFGFNDNMERAVIVFTRYLSGLSAEHQAIWQARQLSGDYKMHPGYYGSSILGQFPEELSLFEAFLEELSEINTLAKLIGKPPLFRETWTDDRPRRFSWIVRPTVTEMDAFILLLDKMLSDNINKKFFADDVPLETEISRDDGKIEVRQKGTIQLLSDWLDRFFVPEDPAPLQDMLKTLRNVRRMRQKPAHTVRVDNWDKAIFENQRQIMIRAYSAIRIIRQLLQNHPSAQGHQVREHLLLGKVCLY